MIFQILFAVFSFLFFSSCEDTRRGLVYPISRGAQVRLTQNGLQYGAGIGVRKLESELRNKNIPPQAGKSGDVTYNAYNILIHNINVGSYAVSPIQNFGLRLAVSNVGISAQGTVSVKYQKGWIKVGDTTNIKIRGTGIGFTLDVKVEARNGKPVLSASGCSSRIGDIDLSFSGGLSWIYNLFSSVLEKKLEDILEKVMCDEGRKLANNEINNFLNNFLVQQNINNWAIIDYSFEQPFVTDTYLDLLLRGEFLDVKDPVPSPITPPQFDTTTDSSKMAYVWITDYTLNSAGRVFHQAGLLKNVISPLTSKLIPKEVQPFLNTRTFEQIIPQLYQQYPDLPIAFHLETFQEPVVNIGSGSADIKIFVKASINVLFTNGTSTRLFYINLSVNGKGSVSVAKENQDLIIRGNIASFDFQATVGGSIIGEIQAIDNQSIKDLVHGLVIQQANPILNNGFPIPKVKDLDFINPSVVIEQGAIRVDTDISYVG